MCYPCTHCNKCGKFPKPGTCYVCGHVNGPSARICENCGNPFPAPPGTPLTADGDGGAQEADA